MPHVKPLQPGDPERAGPYQLTGRVAAMPAIGPAFLGAAPGGGRVVITLVSGLWTRDAAARDRFAAEAAAARQVAPFCTARILDAGYDGHVAYLVSEYVPGPSLRELCETGPLARAEVAALAIGAATGLAAIHQAGLVHGNFGPDHLVAGPMGPRVIEFSITPPYGAATPAADMLAWARTVLFMAVSADLPEPLRDQVELCLTPDPDARPAARAVLLELLGGEPAAGLLAEGSRLAARGLRADRDQPPRPPSRAHQRPARRWRGLVAALAVAALLAVAATALLLISHRPAVSPASASGRATHSPHRRPPPARTASPSVSASSPAPSPAIPAAFAGTWTGQVTQASPPEVFQVTVRLAAGKRSGTIGYSSTTFSCTGELSVRSTTAAKLRMGQGIVTNQQTCANGMVTLRLLTGGSLEFRFAGQSGPAARGTLSRS
jgi:hypothetical protein